MPTTPATTSAPRRTSTAPSARSRRTSRRPRYAKRASMFLFAKKYDEGLRFIEDVAEKTWPDDDTILEQKAVMLSRQGVHKKEAVALAERVVERRPSAYTLQSLLGDYNYQLGARAADKTAARYEGVSPDPPQRPRRAGRPGAREARVRATCTSAVSPTPRSSSTRRRRSPATRSSPPTRARACAPPTPAAATGTAR